MRDILDHLALFGVLRMGRPAGIPRIYSRFMAQRRRTCGFRHLPIAISIQIATDVAHLV